MNGVSAIGHERGMEAAIAACRRGIGQGQSPFGAALWREGELVVAGHNQVWLDTDPTAHAEVTVLRQAARRLGTIDLGGSVLYSTTEPCPMCFAASHWARVGTIVYGASIADAERAGFRELRLSNREMAERGGSPVVVIEGVRRAECLALFAEWAARPDSRAY